MAQLSTKIKLYLTANSKTWDRDKVSLQNNSDGNGDFISSWDYDIAKPTDTQIASYETAGNTAEALQTVLNNRAISYPRIKDQLDMQYKDLLNGTTTWKDAVAKVKSDNPK
tara:strand:- start:50 stop:382 length:333 start_codon:yes stop_codon:yes gene_type:complete